MTSAAPSRYEYHIGIITALPIERAAIKVMLDVQYGKPHDFNQGHLDTNSYTWGRIESHNVVIASLATGVTGNTSATTTALPMLYSFPNIKFGLLVGIGAGVPNTCDIRLGDVAVSQPAGNSRSAVFQYDLGKMVSNEWIRQDILSRPPEVLLKALANLQSEHEVNPQPKAHEYLRNAVNCNPPWGSMFSYPKAEDRLFSDSSVHQSDSANVDCALCDSTKIVKRAQRSSPAEFKIHYGTKESGNSLIKDASLRGKIAHMDDQCICIEMEAAGIMNNFPCLVIRGISDYADCHKNDAWQRYASATAAAFTKELLNYIPLMQFQDTVRAIEVVANQDNRLARNLSDGPGDDTSMDNSSFPDPVQFSEGWSDVSANSPVLQTGTVNEAIESVGSNLVPMLPPRDFDWNESIGKEEDTVLHTAVRMAKYEVLQDMLEKGADIELKNSRQFTPLHLATSLGESRIVRLLLDRNANIEAQNHELKTPLHIAASEGLLEVSRLLIDYKARIESENEANFRPLHYAARNGHLEVVTLLMEEGAHIEAETDKKARPLHLAALNNHLEVARILIEKGAHIEAETDRKARPLHLASQNGHLGMARKLIEKGADIEAETHAKARPLHLAAYFGHLAVVEMLLAKKANIEAETHAKVRPLHLASYFRHVDIVRTLIARGAMVNVADVAGNSALHWAVDKNLTHAVRLLLVAGADVLARNNQNEQPLYIAKRNGFSKIAKLLRRHGA